MIARLTLENDEGLVYTTATTTRLWCDFSGMFAKS